MTAQVLQTPEIIAIEGSTIRVRHPDISGYTRTTMIDSLTAAGTSLSVRDNNNFEDNDWFIFGEIGNAKSEECDVNGAVTRGSALTITNSTKFDHELDTPVTRIFERAFKIYGAATDGGAGTLLESVDAKTASTNQLADSIMVQWDRMYSEWTFQTTDTAYAFYYVTFFDGTTESPASDYVASTGLAFNAAYSLAQKGLNLARAEVDNELITWQFLSDTIDDFQKQVTDYVKADGQIKDWPFEEIEDKTSLVTAQNQDSYALSGLSSTLKYPDTFQGIIHVKLGAEELRYADLDKYQYMTEGQVRTEVDTQAAIGATSIILDDVSEFGDSGSFYISTQTGLVTYTARDTSTNTLSGIPTAGNGSLTSIATVDAIVWQGVVPSKPTRYTIFNDNILLTAPPDANTAGKRIKIKYFKELDRITALSQTLPIPFVHISKYFIAAQIEYRKKNSQNGDRYLAIFNRELDKAAKKYQEHLKESSEYYTFTTNLNP